MTEKNTPLDTRHIQMGDDDISVLDQKKAEEDLPPTSLDHQEEGGCSEKPKVARGGVKYQRRSTALRDNLLKRKQQMRLRKEQD
ncbi:MAG: hypothetical protein ACTHJ4_00880 [Candidatus Nucleicultricaceae bacterium]